MSPSEYAYYKAMFEAFGKDILIEFKEQYQTKEVMTSLSTKDVIAGAVKCFRLYMAAKENELKEKANGPH